MRMQARSLRRGSILGPIVLIAAGIVFLLLQTGRLDHARAWDWYGRFWPFLLVAAGLIVLAEWAFDQHLLRNPERPPYRRSFGGGVFLLLLFALLGAGVIGHGMHPVLHGFARLFPGTDSNGSWFDQMIGDKHESDQTLDYAMDGRNGLFLVNPNGNVSISGTSYDGRIHVAIHKQVYANSDTEADDKAAKLVPSTSNLQPSFNLTMPSLEGARADLVVTVPDTTATTATADHGDVHIDSIKNAVTVNTNQGSVDLSDIAGPAIVRMNNTRASFAARSMGYSVTVQGRANDLTVTDAGQVNLDGQFFGPTHLENIRGLVHFNTSRTDLQLRKLDGRVDINNSMISADQAAGPVVLHTSYRNVSLDRIAGDVAVTNRNGTVDLLVALPLGNVSIENRNGAVNVTMPQKASFAVNASTTNGAFNTDFQLSSSGSGRSRFLTGNVGSGGPLLHLATSEGDISIHKDDEKPVAATASSSTLLKSGTYQIINGNSGMALESPGMSHTQSLHMSQARPDHERNQLWTLANVGGDTYTVRNSFSSQVLDVGGASEDSGALVNQFPYNDGDNQKWRIVPVGNGQYEFINLNSGLALDVKGSSTNPGAVIQQFTYHGGSNQKWTLLPQGTAGAAASPPASAAAPAHPPKRHRGSAQ